MTSLNGCRPTIPCQQSLFSTTIRLGAVLAALVLVACATPRNVDVEAANRDGAAGNGERDGGGDRAPTSDGRAGQGGPDGRGGQPGEPGGPESDAQIAGDVPAALDGNGPAQPDAAATVDLAPEIDMRPACLLDQTRCAGNSVETCDAAAKWSKKLDCPFVCQAGACAGSCRPGDKRCVANQTPETCSAAGEWMPEPRCQFVCSGKGVCGGSCIPGTKRCAGAGNLAPEICDENGAW
ncbi:MAG TPA: hypothetical protein VGF45_03710, partial [Polyangia bacterium]